MITHIYVLCDPNTQEVRYIGQAKNIQQRWLEHTNYKECCKHTRKAEWVRTLMRAGTPPEIFVIETVTKAEALEREVLWIRRFMQIGARLTNQSYFVCQPTLSQ